MKTLDLKGKIVVAVVAIMALSVTAAMVVGLMATTSPGVSFRLMWAWELCMMLLVAGFCLGFALNTFCASWEPWTRNPLGISLCLIAIVLLIVSCVWAMQLGVARTYDILQINICLIFTIGFGCSFGLIVSGV